MRRIGLFGGTFDPPHLGHLALAENARDRLGLDRVRFIPAGQPPHKRAGGVSPAAVRVAMTRLAARGNPAFEVSTIETRRGGPSFTIETLRAVAAETPGARLYLLMGTDTLDDFAAWREPEAILRLASLVVAERPGSGGRLPVPRGGRVLRLDNPELAISSSAIRRHVRAGRSIRYLVPDAVATYIRRHELYREAAMTYRPREFWEERLSGQFDLRGTGETGLSLAYNRACYALRRRVLDRALRDQGFDPRGRAVLDVGCGTGFFTAYYLERGARVTGMDIAPTAVANLSQRHPEATFLLADVSEQPPPARYDLVNAFDVLYHITDDERWARAVQHLAAAVEPGGLLLISDTFRDTPGVAEHNRMRPLRRYEELFERAGLRVAALRPTHVLLNRELGPFRSLNRLPGLLLAADRALLGLGFGRTDAHTNKLLVARRARAAFPSGA